MHDSRQIYARGCKCIKGICTVLGGRSQLRWLQSKVAAASAGAGAAFKPELPCYAARSELPKGPRRPRRSKLVKKPLSPSAGCDPAPTASPAAPPLRLCPGEFRGCHSGDNEPAGHRSAGGARACAAPCAGGVKLTSAAIAAGASLVVPFFGCLASRAPRSCLS